MGGARTAPPSSDEYSSCHPAAQLTAGQHVLSAGVADGLVHLLVAEPTRVADASLSQLLVAESTHVADGESANSC